MPSYGGFTVRVVVDNKMLDEYGTVVSDDGRTVTCYVVAEEGKRYNVRGSLAKNFTGAFSDPQYYHLHMKVDGELQTKRDYWEG